MAGVYHVVGKYKAEIISAQLSESKSGTPQVELTFNLLEMHIEGGQVIDDFDRGKFGPKIYLSLTEKTMGTPEQPGWVRETLSFLGLSESQSLEEVECLQGKHCLVDMHVGKTVDGKEREEWSVIRPVTFKKSEAIDPKKVKGINKFFGYGKAPGASKPVPVPAVKTPPVPSGEAPPEDAPF